MTSLVVTACAITAFALGWAAPLPLARRLLQKRAVDASPPFHQTTYACLAARARTLLPRMACASALALFSRHAWQAVHAASADGTEAAWASYVVGAAWAGAVTWAAFALAMLAGTIVLCALACDLRARILPWELCLALLATGCAYGLVIRGPTALAASLAAAAIAVGVLVAVRAAASHAGRDEPIGAGDLRLMPGLFAMCGIQGSLTGALTCSVAMGVAALVVLACRAAKGMQRRINEDETKGVVYATSRDMTCAISDDVTCEASDNVACEATCNMSGGVVCGTSGDEACGTTYDMSCDAAYEAPGGAACGTTTGGTGGTDRGTSGDEACGTTYDMSCDTPYGTTYDMTSCVACEAPGEAACGTPPGTAGGTLPMAPGFCIWLCAGL